MKAEHIKQVLVNDRHEMTDEDFTTTLGFYAQALLSEQAELLTDLLEYMDNRADADGDSEGFTPNTEMSFKVRIEEALEKIK